jgi:NADPH:quinone reductase-like Zn-dependent oxidoreductase
MKAAVVSGPNQTPVYGDFASPPVAPGEVAIAVTAAALSQLAKGRASGAHYSSSGEYPFVAGVDGVGRLADGRRVYFVLPEPPYGSMAEQVAIRPARCLPVPDGLDDVTAAAVANPGMSSWAAFKERARLAAGETVLVNGATGSAGRLAVQIAKHLGAGRVIATGRNVEALASLAALGADATVPLETDRAALDGALEEQFAKGIDIVVDYLWGPSAERILAAAARSSRGARPVRFVQIGSISGDRIELPGAVLRSTAIELMGSGIGSVPLERLIQAIGGVLQAAAPGGLKIATQAIPLSAVAAAWNAKGDSRRTVFVNPE